MQQENFFDRLVTTGYLSEEKKVLLRRADTEKAYWPFPSLSMNVQNKVVEHHYDLLEREGCGEDLLCRAEGVDGKTVLFVTKRNWNSRIGLWLGI